MGNLGLINFSVWCILAGCSLIDNKVKSDNTCDIEISEILRTLLNPEENDSIQVQALRRQLLRKLKEDLAFAELEDERNYKRNMASLTAWNNLPDENKRNLEALARAGTWYKNPPESDQNEDTNYKRSIANLAKNGQPPLMPLPLEKKRGIESLARNGELNRRQNYQTLLDTFGYKRNVPSLTRDYNFPVGGTAGFGKRTIGSLAKNGDFRYLYGKRNIQALARDGNIGKRSVDYVDISENKPNIQSGKSHSRNKRQADYFENEVVYQMPTDYEDILQDLAATQDIYSVEDKRFLGSVAKSGWYQPRGYSRFTSLPEKRHVASLARLGWLPSYRSVRRFNRSGRSFLRANDDQIVCRADSSNGKTKDYSYSKITSVPLETKRYPLQNPASKNQFRPPRIAFNHF